MADRPTGLYRKTQAFIHFASRFLGGVTVIGTENIPTDGPAILAPNHRANIDPPYLSLITSRPITYMAKEELFKVPLFGGFIRRLGAFPVRRGAADRAALRQAIAHLKEGHLVIIFPEGTRSEDGRLKEAEKGFALIARQTDVPIIPIAIDGTEKILPKGAKWPQRGPTTIKIGLPITVAQILSDSTDKREALPLIGEATMTAIGALLGFEKEKSK